MITWDPQALARIRHLLLYARQSVGGVEQGTHRSIARGTSLEFVDYKPYVPGDPTRNLDWKVWARSDRWVLRRFKAESNLPSMLVLDASGDMATGGTGTAGSVEAGRPPLNGSKHGYAICLAATIAYYLYLRGEPVGLRILGGREARWNHVPPRKGREHLGRILAVLASVQPWGQAHIGQNLNHLRSLLGRGALVLLLSDLMEELDTWIPSIRHSGAYPTDVRVVHIQDRGELSLSNTDPANLFSPEGGTDLPLDPLAARPAYRREVEGWLAQVQFSVVQQGARYLSAPTDLSISHLLARLVSGASVLNRETWS